MTDTAMLQRLLLIEQSLSASIKGHDGAGTNLPSEHDLEELKLAFDRMRPLLWIYLNRKRGRPMMQSSSDPSLIELMRYLAEAH